MYVFRGCTYRHAHTYESLKRNDEQNNEWQCSTGSPGRVDVGLLHRVLYERFRAIV